MQTNRNRVRAPSSIADQVTPEMQAALEVVWADETEFEKSGRKHLANSQSGEPGIQTGPFSEEADRIRLQIAGDNVETPGMTAAAYVCHEEMARMEREVQDDGV